MKTLKLGQIFIAPGALAALDAVDVANGLERHAGGDWGDLCAEDRTANDAALVYGARILSLYATKAGIRFWIITESDRSSTTILLPEEY